MSKENWIYMPHAGHFIVGHLCRFRLNTYVNGFIVSTVGEYVPDSQVRKIFRKTRGRETALRGDAEETEFGFEKIGCDRLYETMVFRGRKSKNKCCPYEVSGFSELDFAGYNKPEDAYKGHIKMCLKFDKTKVAP
jgi:hypothetical protein